MKFCRVCLACKPLDDFYTCKTNSDGRQGSCKVCFKAKARRWKEQNRERSRLLSRLSYIRRKPVESERKKAWINNNPEKRRAHHAVNNAVRDGRLIKPDECSRCGTRTSIQGHHRDYSKPLDVVWVCSLCHRRIHIEEERIGIENQKAAA
jgi:hypothetical protein